MIDEFWNFWDIYLYTSILHYNHRHSMVWSKRPRTLVICRYRSDRFEVGDFSQAFSLGYNVELLSKTANSSPESGETKRTSSPKTLERALLHVEVLHLLSMRCFSASTFTYSEKFLFTLASNATA